MGYSFTQNRELSWLKFNERVLQEAEKKDLPTFERLNYVSIFTSNLDEFFMIRVGSLHDIAAFKSNYKDNKTGMNAKEQINAIMQSLTPMYKEKDLIFDKVMKEMKIQGINQLKFSELDENQLNYVKKYFDARLLPLVSPQIINKSHPFPFLENKRLYVLLEFDESSSKEKEKRNYGLIPLREDFDPFIILPNVGTNFHFILTEDVMLGFADRIFNQPNIINKSIISVTRNFDFSDTEELKDEFDDYKAFMKVILKKRQRLSPVRVESNTPLSSKAISFLSKNLDLEKSQFFTLSSPINMEYVSTLGKKLNPNLKESISYNKFTPHNPHPKELTRSYIKLIEQKDRILSYPYDDFEMFLSLIKEASKSKNVLSIKITIYRLAKNSKLVKYLCNAAENGVEVTALMELKARFDEENNINYSDVLYEAGCNIIYGFENYKTHSKICLITYKDENENIKYITQIGTGNYNENTSKIYTDFSLMTANSEIGKDAGDFFYNISTGILNGKYKHLLQSPSTFKPTLLEKMNKEIAKGEKGRILFKMNSLTDLDFIKKLSEAVKNKVKVQLIIRGISCFIPENDDENSNLQIRSIVGRFLEHSRVYIFSEGKDREIYISSADLMTRNTEKRVEIACPIYDEDIKDILENYLMKQMIDNVGGRSLDSKGDYNKILDDEKISSQDYFMKEANSAKQKIDEKHLIEENKSHNMTQIKPEEPIEKETKLEIKKEKNFWEKFFSFLKGD